MARGASGLDPHVPLCMERAARRGTKCAGRRVFRPLLFTLPTRLHPLLPPTRAVPPLRRLDMDHFEQDEGCYARYNKEFHRAWVERQAGTDWYHVKFQDFGEQAVVHVSDLKKLSTVTETMFKVLAPEDRQYMWPAVRPPNSPKPIQADSTHTPALTLTYMHPHLRSSLASASS